MLVTDEVHVRIHSECNSHVSYQRDEDMQVYIPLPHTSLSWSVKLLFDLIGLIIVHTKMIFI